MAIRSMEDVLMEELRDIYSAERLALRSYPRIRKGLRTRTLQEAVDRHTEQTRGQIDRLTRVFEIMGAKARGKTSHSMQGLLDEAEEHLGASASPELREVLIVADLQKIEHYEIAAYGAAKAHAEALGLRDAIKLLDETLNEERETDSLLNRIAAKDVNPAAIDDSVDDEQDAAAEPEAPRKQARTEPARGKQAQSKLPAKRSKDDVKSRMYRERRGSLQQQTRAAGSQSNR